MRFKLSPTSALVLLWAEEESYKSESARDFFRAINLDEGRLLLEQFNSVWGSYNEVIKNRKFGVWALSEKFLNTAPSSQVVCLGAGLDPLSLDIAEQFPDSNIFDVDLENMDLKADIIRKIRGSSNIHFVTSDISETDSLLDSLKAQGWNSSKPTLAIVEGLSYFLSEESLRNALNKLCSKGAAVIEHLVPLNQVNKERRNIPKTIFEKIQSDFGLPFITKYGESEIKDFSEKINLRWDQTLRMIDIEKKRTGKNDFFPLSNSGWICVSSMTHL